MLRSILILAVVVSACFVCVKYSEHHTGTNTEAFELLYKHVEPAMLIEPHHEPVEHSHDGGAAHSHDSGPHPLIAVPLPAFLGFFGDNRLEEPTLVASNLQIFQIAAVLLIFIAFSGVPGYLRTGKGDAVTRFLTGFCMWIRDEVVRPVMGEKDGDRFLPLFLAIFFFILFMNVMGLVPGSVTATANIYVTAALAIITLLTMIGCGMAAQGPIAFWKNLVPHVPLAMWPLMFIIELMGLLIKPFALTVRLFANMMGGHLVVLSFMGLIFYFAGPDMSKMGYAVSPFAIGFGVFIMIIEAFVAMLQAYIFTQLSVIFVGASIHPEH